MKTLYVNYKSVVSTLVVLLIGLSAHLTSFAEVTPVSERTQQVQNAIVAAVPNVNAASDVTETHLAAITRLNLRSKGITALKSGDFSGLSGLTDLNLYGNQLSSLSNGIFEGLTALTKLRLGGNTTNPILLTVSLEKVGDNQFKAVAPTGAPFAIVLPVSATNGSISGDATTLTISKGNVESDAVTVTRTEGMTDALTVNIGTLPSLPANHYGYNLSKSDALPVEVISAESTPTIPSGADEIDTATPAIEPPPVTPVTPDPPDEVPENNAPTFTEGAITKRSVAENTAANTNIGTAVSATDSDSGDTLSYTLGGVDAASFDIDSATGQLKTKAALDYETKRVYAVSITVSDGSLRDTISVIISVINKADTVLDTSILSVSDRTPQVRDAIVAAVPGITDAADVTATHLAAIASLNLRNKDISALKSGDFSGLSSMTSLNLYGNMLSSLPNGIFAGLTSLTSLRLGGNTVSPMPLIVWLEQVSNDMYKVSIPAGAPFDVAVRVVLVDGELRETLRTVTISKGSVKSDAFWVPVVQSGSIVIGALPNLPSNHFGYVLTKSGACNLTPQVAAAITAVVPGVTDCRNLSETDLATIISLNLNNKSITSLRSDDFAALLSLTSLDLRNNQLSSLPDGIFAGLTRLTTVQLSGNTGAPFSLEVSLEKVGTNMVRATIPTGAPFDIVLPISLANGSLAGNASSVTISTGRVRSTALLVTRTTNTTGAVTANIGTLPSIPATHNGYTLAKSTAQPLEIFRRINVAPVFTAGTTATRSIAENTATGTNIGTAVSATDADGDTLSYTLSGADASSFSIVSTSGQLQAKASLDYETKASYSVTVSVSDGNGGSDTITATITITDVAENVAPVFTDGATTTRSIAENTAAGTNIGTAIAATDANTSDTLTYTLSDTDAASFAIVSTSGQLQTKSALNYERKSSYTVTVSVSDGNGGSDSITVTINITNVLNEGTQQSNVNVAPVFTDGVTATRSIAENTAAGTNIGTAIAATDANTSDTLTYTLSGADAASFDIVDTSGQLQTKAALNYERKNSYTVTVSVSDGNDGSDSITVTINITNVLNEGAQQSNVNVAPVFTAGTTTTRSIAENTATGVNIGTTVSATDADSDTLTYSLGETDAASFSIVSTTGQLQTKAALDYETKTSYSVTITVSDGTATDSITVTIIVTDQDETPASGGLETKDPPTPMTNSAPVFSDGASTTRSIAENTATGTNIGTAVTATDANSGDTLTYSLGGIDAASFAIVSTSGQLQTKAALNYERKTSYSVTITVSDGNGGSDSITVTINITNVVNEGTAQQNTNSAPTFTEGIGATRSVAENTAAGTNIGTAVAATDANSGDTLTYSLGGTDAASFAIVSTSGQLQTKAALNFEVKNSYSVTVTAFDGTVSASIDITINVTDVDPEVEEVVVPLPLNIPPKFYGSDESVFTIAENSPSNSYVGDFNAYDQEDPLPNFTLGGTDAASFTIGRKTGTVRSNASFDYETKDTYSVIITVTDDRGASDSVTLTVRVTNVNEAPEFTDGDTATRSIPENTAANSNIGSVFEVDDPEDDTFTYSLGGTNAASFSIDSSTGQLKTKASLDYETKTSYTVAVTASDGKLTDSITVTINVTNLDETPSTIVPVFTDGTTTTRSVAENSAAGTNIGTPIAATDSDNNTLAYVLSGSDAASFNIDSSTGQLKTSIALDHETKASYSMTVTVSDGTLSDTITVTINVTDANDAPVFVDGTSTTRVAREGKAVGTNIGATVFAMDADDDMLTYTLGGTDASSFTIGSSTGQLKAAAIFEISEKASYSVTVTVSDGTLTDTIDVQVTVRRNRQPRFRDSNFAVRYVPENTPPGTNIGTPFSATDQDGDTLTYTLGGNSASSFNIVSNTGQLKTKDALNYEVRSRYTAAVTVSDGESTGTISITVRVQDVNDAPVFSAGDTAERPIAENTAASTNIGSAFSATDADNDTLVYTLGGTDAASFSIVNSTGQLKTKAQLDYETKTSYTVKITVSDGKTGGTDTITVTINITDVENEANNAPVFSAGDTAERPIAENTAAGTNIGSAFSATDTDNDTLVYTLGGTDASSFSIVSSTGQLKTKAALDYETKTSYTVKITVSDGKIDGTDTITVTINVTDVTGENNPPVFTEGATATRSIAEYSNATKTIGDPVSATDSDGETLTYSFTGDSAFSIDSSTGQLSSSGLDYEKSISYTLTVKVTDSNGGSDTIEVTVNITNVNEAPYFTGRGATDSVDVLHDAASDTNIGEAFGATDPEEGTLTYTLSGTNADSFSIVSTTGQLKIKDELDIDTQSSYTVIITVSDGTFTDTITVTINVINPPNPPVSSRTHEIRDAIVSAIEGVDSATDVTTAHLKTITEIDLSSNEISLLSAGDFNGLSNLRELTLNHNDLVSLPEGIFDELTNLRELNLSYNNLASLPDDIFDNLTNLRELYLRYNGIDGPLQEGIFDNLTELRKIDLEDNDLGSVRGDLFSNNTELQYMDISDSGLSSVPDGFFAGLTKLNTMNISQLEYNLYLYFNVEEIDDEDNNDSTAKIKVTLKQGSPHRTQVPLQTVIADVKTKVQDVTFNAGDTESDPITITRAAGVTLAMSVTVDPDIYHGGWLFYGHYFKASDDLPLEIIPAAAGAPGTAKNATEPVPETTALLANFPNPFNPETWIPYQLARQSSVSITIYDIRGNVVRQLYLGQRRTGFYTDRSRAAHWDGRNKLGERVANGVYFYVLKAGDYAATRKMLIVK